MATVKQITSLCKEGRIDEAIAISAKEFEQDPQNEWAQRAYGWALYYKFRSEIEEENTLCMLDILDKLSKIPAVASGEDTMISEGLLWRLSSLVRSQESAATLDELFPALQQFTFKPSKPYSLLLAAVLRHKDWNRLAEFIDWWNLDNLMPEDYRKEQLENGKRIMSLAERAYIAYSKALLAIGDLQRISAFLPKLQKLSYEHHEMLYPGYFCGKLMIASGADPNQTVKAIRHFVRKKSGEFWAWQLMGEAWSGDRDKSLACYLRASHCKAKEDYLVNVRRALALIYMDMQDYPRARYQAEKIHAIYSANGWRTPYDIYRIVSNPVVMQHDPNASDPMDFMRMTDGMINNVRSTHRPRI